MQKTELMRLHSIKTLEERFNFSQVKFENENIWPVLRIYYFFKLRDLQVSGSASESQVFLKRLNQRLRSFPRGFGHFIKSLFTFRDSYICFSDSYELRLISEKAQNKLFFSLFNKIGADNFLYFEKPVDQKLFSSSGSAPQPISTSVIDMMALVISFFIGSVKIENEVVLKNSESELGFKLNYTKLLKLLKAYRLISYYLLKLYRPRAVFLSEYYNLFHMAVCYSANSLGVPVMEFQHGIINKEHPAYNFYSGRVRSKYLPSYFSAFGQKFIDSLGSNSFLPQERIVVGGHSYLSFLAVQGMSVATPERYQGFLNKILITLQWTDEKQVIDFIVKLSSKSAFSQTLFILLPRQWNEAIHGSYSLPENVKFEREFDFYKMMKMVDIHVTTYSTTALEAPFFGLPNILLNFDQMAKKYFNSFIEPSVQDYYVETEEEFVSAFRSIQVPNLSTNSERNIIQGESLDAILNLIKVNNSK